MAVADPTREMVSATELTAVDRLGAHPWSARLTACANR